ncbi:MAG: type II secretion system F family protein [Clostridiales bacterium]|nr:type II secretion system F family protein [Clostridiales bacterium]
MGVYEYKARNMEGALISGELVADSQDRLEDMLRDKGYYLVDCREKIAGLKLSLFKKARPRDIAVFCRQFSVLLNAGVTIVEAMSILKGQTENRHLGGVLADAHEQLQRGSVLSQAMGMHADVFEEFFINMIKVGEASGTLDSVMSRLADYYERDNKISQKVRSAMTYPVILAILTVAVIILLMVQVLPMFRSILVDQMGGQLPGITAALMSVSNFFVSYFPLILFLIAALVVLWQYFGRSESGRYWMDWLKLTAPGFRNVTRKIVTARFARSLGILLKSGIPIISAVDIIKNMIGNRVVEKRFEACAAAIKEGKGIAGPVGELAFFPDLLVHMIAIGESSGELDEMLGRTAGFFDLEVEESIDRLTVMIEPLLIIVLGAVVGVIIVSIMLPMISIMTSM